MFSDAGSPEMTLLESLIYFMDWQTPFNKTILPETNSYEQYK